VERGSTNRQATHPAVISSNTPQVVLKRRTIKTIPRPLDRLDSLALVTLIRARWVFGLNLFITTLIWIHLMFYEEQVTQKYAIWCAEAARPFSALEDNSLKTLLHPTVLKHLPNRRMVSKANHVLYTAVQEAFKLELKVRRMSFLSSFYLITLMHLTCDLVIRPTQEHCILGWTHGNHPTVLTFLV
jgi:hypothetical protein